MLKAFIVSSVLISTSVFADCSALRSNVLQSYENLIDSTHLSSDIIPGRIVNRTQCGKAKDLVNYISFLRKRASSHISLVRTFSTQCGRDAEVLASASEAQETLMSLDIIEDRIDPNMLNACEFSGF